MGVVAKMLSGYRGCNGLTGVPKFDFNPEAIDTAIHSAVAIRSNKPVLELAGKLRLDMLGHTRAGQIHRHHAAGHVAGRRMWLREQLRMRVELWL